MGEQHLHLAYSGAPMNKITSIDEWNVSPNCVAAQVILTARSEYWLNVIVHLILVLMLPFFKIKVILTLNTTARFLLVSLPIKENICPYLYQWGQNICLSHKLSLHWTANRKIDAAESEISPFLFHALYFFVKTQHYPQCKSTADSKIRDLDVVWQPM